LIIDNELKSLIPPLAKEEKEILEKDILKDGIREPLIVWKGILVDGHNRYEISQKYNLKFKTQEKKFERKTDALLWMINNQLGRRNLANYDRVRLALKYEEILSPPAKERQKNPFKNYNKSSTGNDGVGAMLPQGRVRKQISKIAKVGERTISKVKLIEKNASENQKKQLSEQTKSINKVYNEVKREIANKVSKEEIKPISKEKFSIIYADPPWRYSFSPTEARSIELHYPTLNLKQIKNLKVPSEENAVLFLWTTAPKLREGLEVLNSWGFEYKTCAVWDKEIIGMGYWFRGQHEILLLGTKGKVKIPEPKNRFSSVIKERRTKHSKKPKQTYEMIEKMFPNEKYIELFARKKRDNWECWGNEINKEKKEESIKDLIKKELGE
jgi:N6-adenosine-specific RNA methylase IME4